MAFFEELEVTIHEELDRGNHGHTSLIVSSGGKSSPSGSDTYNATYGNSTSDEDQQMVDDRKQRRMLSNRESARRSRLRKQQHLDELRSHVAQLRAQNSQMLSSFSLTSKHYAQVAEENRILRSEAINMSHQLQSLHDAMVLSRHHPIELAHNEEISQSLGG
ncbi:hypothetical protein GOP47_0012065 [Adiantum capillus-veneris]|uniref:BZIP domain-containing protein n=1 Tax=Adiantum capillus-veneris TaxID=13818 RepID=A0A9D4UV64_ADICA|nr:hypothetical protein GOP47_0012065 [Adiantum capillus-veneris]